MGKIKQIIILAAQIAGLLILLLSLSYGGMSSLLGGTFSSVSLVIIEFGLTAICLFSSALAFYLPTRRHRILRDAQIHATKYLSILGLYQVLALFMSEAIKTMAIAGQTLHPILINVLVMTYCMFAFMMPFNYIKGLFNVIKSVEFRDPRQLIRQFFE